MTSGITVGGVFLAIAGLTAPAHAGGGGCASFLDQGEFEVFCTQQGKVIKGVEDFEPPIGDVPPLAIAVLASTLEGNVPNVDVTNGFGFPDGLANKNLVIQTNALGSGAPDVVVGGSLLGMGQGFWDGDNVPNSIVVGPNSLSDSLDLIFPPGENHTGVGFDVIVLAATQPDAHISVFDENNQLIAEEVVPAQQDKSFFGIWCPVTIGRINIAGLGLGGQDGGELVDNIQMWMESAQAPACPCDCALPFDKMVGVLDFLAVLAQWGNPGLCDCEDPPDGVVDVGDILAILAAWGPCPAPANDECANPELIVQADPEGTTAVPFDMYGATASPEPYQCLADEPVHKDTWYCLTNDTGQLVGVTITTAIPLYLEVHEGCGCPPGPVIACGDGLVGTGQFPMEPGALVLIRLIDSLDLPNDGLVGSMSIQSEPIVVEPVNFFAEPGLFQEALLEAGLVQRASWSFKDDYLLDGQSSVIDDPLDILTHAENAPDVWWDGQVNLWPPLVDNVQFSSNLSPPEPFEPRGANGLWYGKPGAVPELTNNALVANNFVDSFAIICGPPAGSSHTALGLELIGLDVDGVPEDVTIQISVYDASEVLMGTYTVEAVQGEKPFLGILTKDPSFTIGRVDIWDLLGAAEGISSIALYEPGVSACPCDCEAPPDGTVDVGDFLAFLAQFGGLGTCDCEDPPDGVVDIGDFLAFLAAWGPCPTGLTLDRPER